eukprot:5941879-Amphidinium_carterae.1
MLRHCPTTASCQALTQHHRQHSDWTATSSSAAAAFPVPFFCGAFFARALLVSDVAFDTKAVSVTVSSRLQHLRIEPQGVNLQRRNICTLQPRLIHQSRQTLSLTPTKGAASVSPSFCSCASTK